MSLYRYFHYKENARRLSIEVYVDDEKNIKVLQSTVPQIVEHAKRFDFDKLIW